MSEIQKVTTNIEITLADGGGTLPVGSIGDLVSVREDAPYGYFATVRFHHGLVLEVETTDLSPYTEPWRDRLADLNRTRFV